MSDVELELHALIAAYERVIEDLRPKHGGDDNVSAVCERRLRELRLKLFDAEQRRVLKEMRDFRYDLYAKLGWPDR